MNVLVLGCGFVGQAFGQRCLQNGSQVVGTCRSQSKAYEIKAKGIAPIIFDGNASEELVAMTQKADVILACAPPNPSGDPFLETLHKPLTSNVSCWIGYLSTTGVYGDRQGGWAFEEDLPTPISIEAKRRVSAEQGWQSLPSAAHVFRLPGIYGPGRSALEQAKAGTLRRIDKPGQVFSRAHRDDIVVALFASVSHPNPKRIYNICDDLPCASGEVSVEACRLLGIAPPPLVPFEQAGLSEMGRRFYSECKRVSNARAKSELKWRPRFPTFVEGLEDCFAQTDRQA